MALHAHKSSQPRLLQTVKTYLADAVALMDDSRRAGCSSLLLSVILFASAASARADETEDKKKRRVVRQGGYVEHVDPNVDYKARLPRLAPKAPAESLKAFHVMPGFRLDLVAAEPMVCDAVDLAFDEDGYLFVAELITYSEAGDTMSGRVSRLEDTDGDGVFDASTVYVDRLRWPTGLACFDGGIFIASSPDLLYCKDTDGDGKADLREVVVTGFDDSNPNSCPNSLRWGLDGRIHGMASTSGGVLRAVKWARTAGDAKPAPVQSRGRDFSIAPRTGELRLESGGSQYGMTYDVWERKFECSNSVPIEMVVYDDRYIARNPYLVAPSPRIAIRAGANKVFRTSPVEPWRVIRTEMRIGGDFSGPVEGGGTPAGYFTAACGVMIYTGNAWPKEYRGNAFVGEGAGNLVHRMRLEASGLTLTAHRTEQNREFLTSDEVWFRPIQFANAPDGTLYMADMYREIFEHPDAVPPSVKKYIDLNAGNDRGRIYRIAPTGFRPPRRERLGALSSEKLVELLAHPNGWHRRTASRLLYERQDSAVIERLAKLSASSSSPLGRMHALYALAAQGGLAPEVAVAALGDEHPRVREHAVRLSEGVLAGAYALQAGLCALASDDDVGVRHQLAYTLGEIASPSATAALASIAERDAGNRWIRLAVLSSTMGRAGDLFALMIAKPAWRSSGPGRALLEALAEQAGRQGRSDQVATVFKTLDAVPSTESAAVRGVVRGLSKGLEASGSPLLAQLSGGNMADVLADLLVQAKKTAANAAQPVDKRVGAIRSLASAPFDEVREVLSSLLDSREPGAVQAAALQALGRFESDKIAAVIIDAWDGFSPAVRGEATEALFARGDRLPALLGAIEDERIVASQLDPARLRVLLGHPNEKISERAAELFGDRRIGNRKEVVDAYRDVLAMPGDKTRGKEVFKKICATCHKLEGVGYDLGLPLASIKNRGRETILLSLLDPNREVNPQYLSYTLMTKKGVLITGMITAETATSVTLQRGEGLSDTVLRADIQFLESSDMSIMPEALEDQMTKDEMAGLIEYLMSIR